MYAISQPVMSISVQADSLSQIQNELTAFGLNPNDWCAVPSTRQQRSRLILIHREDTDLRLAVDINGDPGGEAHAKIRDVEMIVL